MLWLRPWWTVYCEHWCLSLILVLWFRWSLLPQEPQAIKSWSWEIFYQSPGVFSPWPEGLLRSLRSSSILLVAVKVTYLFYIHCLWSQMSPEHSGIGFTHSGGCQLLGLNTFWGVPVNNWYSFRSPYQRGSISHPPKRVTWIWISRYCTRIESFF